MKFANYAKFKSAPISDPSLMSLSRAAAAAARSDLCKSWCCIFCQMLNTECAPVSPNVAAAASLITETREGEEPIHQVG